MEMNATCDYSNTYTYIASHCSSHSSTALSRYDHFCITFFLLFTAPFVIYFSKSNVDAKITCDMQESYVVQHIVDF